jgi:hypothetical protein
LAAVGIAVAVFVLLQDPASESITVPEDPMEGTNVPATNAPGKDRDPLPSSPESVPRPQKPTPEGWTLSGRILDGGRLPIPGAPVTVAFSTEPGRALPIPPEAFALLRHSAGTLHWPSTRSGPDGRFSFPNLTTVPVLVLAGPPGYLEAWRIVSRRDDPQEIELILEKGLAVQGRVIAAGSQTGAADVALSALQAPGAEDPFRGRRFRSARTDENGRFRLEGFKPGWVEIDIRLERNLYLEVDGGGHRRVKAGEENLVFKLTGVGIVDFDAVEAGTQKRLAGSIRVRVPPPWNGRFKPSASLQEPGHYVLRGYPEVKEYILESRGYVPVRVRFHVRGGNRVTHPEPVLFSRGGMLQGKVTLTSPPPWKGVFVYVIRQAQGNDPIRFVRVSRGGMYQLGGMSPGRYRVLAFAPAFRPGRAEIRIEGETTRQDFHLQPRLPSDPPPKATAPYGGNKDFRISLAMDGLPVREAILWIREITGVNLTVRPDTDLTGDPGIHLQLEDIPLSTALAMILRLQNLQLDEETGEIFK